MKLGSSSKRVETYEHRASVDQLENSVIDPGSPITHWVASEGRTRSYRAQTVRSLRKISSHVPKLTFPCGISVEREIERGGGGRGAEQSRAEQRENREREDIMRKRYERYRVKPWRVTVVSGEGGRRGETPPYPFNAEVAFP